MKRHEHRTGIKLKRFRLPSPAMIVAMVALFVALGGTSYALTKKDKKKVRNIAGQVASAKVFGATSTDAGAISAATLPGTTVNRTGNNYRYTFPRSVAGCVPVEPGRPTGRLPPSSPVRTASTSGPTEAERTA